MNLSDLVVFITIGGLGLLGLVRGLASTLLGFVTVTVAAVGSLTFYPVLFNILSKTWVFTSIKNVISGALNVTQTINLSSIGDQLKTNNPVGDTFAAVKSSALFNSLINQINIPSLLKSGVVDKLLPKAKSMVDTNSVLDDISTQLAEFAVAAISLLIMFLIIYTCLMVVKKIFNIIAKMPVIKQLNKLGGLAFGIFSGIIILFIAASIIILFSSLPILSGVVANIEASLIAKAFYKDNFIINAIFQET